MPLTLPAATTAMASSAAQSNLQALIPSTGGSLQTVALANAFQQTQEVELRFTRAANGTLGKVVIFKGAGLYGKFADFNTTGTAFSSPDWTGTNAADNMMDYFSKVGMYADGIRFDTDNVANYNESITFGERMPNGTIRGKKVNLSKYRQATGNTYANTADFTDNAKYLVIWAGLYAEMSNLALGSFFSIFLNIPGYDKSINVAEVQY